MKKSITLILLALSLTACSENWLSMQSKTKLEGERKDIFVQGAELALPSKNIVIPQAQSVNEIVALPVYFYNQNQLWDSGLSEKSTNFTLHANSLEHSSNFIVKDDVIYLSDSELGVSAYSLNGERIWTHQIVQTNKPISLHSAFARDEHTITLGASDEYMIAYSDEGLLMLLNIADGTEVLQKRVSPGRSRPIVHGGAIILQTLDGHLRAYDIATLEEKWHYKGLSDHFAAIQIFEPLLIGDSIIAKFSDDEIVSLNAATGLENWSTSISSHIKKEKFNRVNLAASNQLFYDGLNLFAVSKWGHIICLAPETGEVIYNTNHRISSQISISGNQIYAISDHKHIIAIDRLSGNLLFSKELPKDTHHKIAPVMMNDKLFLGFASYDPTTGASEDDSKTPKDEAISYTYKGRLIVAQKGKIILH